MALFSYRKAILIAAGFIVILLIVRSTFSSSTPALDPTRTRIGSKKLTTATSRSSGAHDDPTLQKPLRPSASEGLAPHRPLRHRLAYSFPYDPTSKFPNYIWQTYKSTPASRKFQDKFRLLEASWTERHPGFIHEVITDEVAMHMIRHLYSGLPDVLEAYEAMPLVVLKADFFRYLILLARGGIYTDIDTYAIKSAVNWVPEAVPRTDYGLVIGIEADPDREDWADWYSRRIQFCQWTIQAKPGHPVLLETVAHITEEALRRRKEGTLDRKIAKNVVEFTGPALWTDKIMDYFNDERHFDMSTSSANITWRQFTGMKSPKKVGDTIVLPITCFSPGIRTMDAGEDDDPMAFVKHYFEGETNPRHSDLWTTANIVKGIWKPESERHIGEED